MMLLVLFSLSVSAQDEGASSEGLVQAEILSLKIAEVEASTSLDEQTVSNLVELYRKSLTNLERVRAEKQSAGDFVREAESAEDEIASIVQQRDQQLELDNTPQSTGFESMTLAELEQLLTEEKARLNEIEASRSKLGDSLAFELARPTVAREQLSHANADLERSIEELNAVAPVLEAGELTEARRWYLQTRISVINAEVEKIDKELLTYNDRYALLEAEQELATLKAERLRTRLGALEETIGRRRSAEAELAQRDAEVAQQELEGRPPAVLELAAGNVEFSQQLSQSLLEVSDATERRTTIQRENTALKEELRSTRSKLAIAGVNVAVGQLLVEQKRELPNVRNYEKSLKELEKRISDVALRQIYLGEQRRNLRDSGKFIEGLTRDLPTEHVGEFYPELQTLTTSRVELVDKSIKTGGDLLRVLGELDLAHRKLIETVRSYDDFLEKRLLWVRNTAPVGLDVLATFPDDAKRLLSVASWSLFARDFTATLEGKPLLVIVFVLLLVLAILRGRFLVLVDNTARYVGRIRRDRIHYSIEALFYTLLAAIPLPLLLMVAGKLIVSSPVSADFSNAVASGMVLLGVDLLMIQFFIDTCRSNGLALRHCGWADSTVRKLRGELRWFRVAFPLLRFIGVISLNLDGGSLNGGLAVLCLSGAAVSIAVLVYRLFSPGGGVIREFLESHPESILSRLRPVWFTALTMVMPLLTVLWLSGYNYTGVMLAEIFMYSLWLLLWLMVLQSLITRWLLLGYRRLEFKAAVESAEARRAEESTLVDAADASLSESGELDVAEPKVDYAQLSANSRKLLRTIIFFVAVISLWAIWSPVLPALAILEDVTLWTRMTFVDGETVQMPVTLMNLLIAVVVGVATGALAKGLPSLIEMMLLQSSSLNTGARYTIVTVLRYTLIGVGIIVVYGILGGNWSQIQWLVAALGVGIGFGLQEIVANFISGLIILFERPLRVGDVVSVGDTQGVVTRIQIRATTIRDWDRRELLVPNREFITNRLLNWSLSDTVTRVAVQVGIAYESDLVKALKLTEEAAREHDGVLDDPAPFVIFEGFGDSALKIKLLAYLPSIDNRLKIHSELNASVMRKLEDGGITIAFAQHDVHLDTNRPLEIRMKRE